MRRAQVNEPSQPVRNLFTNPSFENASGTVDVRTNLLVNPSFETNTTGWQGVRGTLTRDTTVAYLGTSSGKYVADGNTGGNYLHNSTAKVPVTAGQQYTISGYMLRDTTPSSWMARFYWYDSANVLISSNAAPAYTALSSTSWTRVNHTAVAPANAATLMFYFIVDGFLVAGTTAWIDAVMIEKATSALPYFDGANPLGSLVANPTFAVNTTGYTMVSATLARVTNQGGDGHVAEIASTVANGGRQGLIWLPGVFHPAGRYTVSFDLMGTATEIISVRAFTYSTTTSQIYSEIPYLNFIRDGKYNRYTFVLNSTASFDRIYMDAITSNAPVGTKVWFDRVLVEPGATPGDYYEGQGDFTYAWTGTANASASIQRGTGIAGIVTPATNMAIIQSGLWSSSGTKSARVVPLTSSQDSGIHISSGTLSLVTGKTYTISATCRLASVQTSPEARARKIVVYHSNTSANSAQAPNAVGSTRLSVTFKVTDGAAYQSIRFYNGASLDGGDVWWDDIMIVEGSNQLPYMDGSKPFAKWEGTPNASISTGYPYG